MPPRASGTSLRGGRSTGKGFKLALPEPSPKEFTIIIWVTNPGWVMHPEAKTRRVIDPNNLN